MRRSSRSCAASARSAAISQAVEDSGPRRRDGSDHSRAARSPAGASRGRPTRYFDDRIRRGLAAAGRIDGLALQLHGACAAEGIDDVEGEQVALCRAILGPNVPIVLGLDHHANVTRKMVEISTAIVGHRTQPHDPFDTGRSERRC